MRYDMKNQVGSKVQFFKRQMLAYTASGKGPEDSERLRKRIREARNKRKNRT